MLLISYLLYKRIIEKKEGENSVQRAIVLAGDNGYMEKLEVTIKSIVATNSQVMLPFIVILLQMLLQKTEHFI